MPLTKGTEDYTQAMERWTSCLREFCKGVRIFDVEKPGCPQCKQTTSQIGKSMTVGVCARCDIAYCMHCCFEQSRSVMSAEKSSVAAVRDHLTRCPSNMFLDSDLFDREVFIHPRVFEQDIARFTIVFIKHRSHQSFCPSSGRTCQHRGRRANAA